MSNLFDSSAEPNFLQAMQLLDLLYALQRKAFSFALIIHQAVDLQKDGLCSADKYNQC